MRQALCGNRSMRRAFITTAIMALAILFAGLAPAAASPRVSTYSAQKGKHSRIELRVERVSKGRLEMTVNKADDGCAADILRFEMTNLHHGRFRFDVGGQSMTVGYDAKLTGSFLNSRVAKMTLTSSTTVMDAPGTFHTDCSVTTTFRAVRVLKDRGNR